MDINTLLVIGFAGVFTYIIYLIMIPSQQNNPQRFGLLVSQDMGKTKHNQSKSGDASLNIERIRRRVIQKVGKINKQLKETSTQNGSASGAIETYMISEVCPCVKTCKSYDIILDGGNPLSEHCEYIGTEYLDAGNANTKACGV